MTEGIHPSGGFKPYQMTILKARNNVGKSFFDAEQAFRGLTFTLEVNSVRFDELTRLLGTKPRMPTVRKHAQFKQDDLETLQERQPRALKCMCKTPLAQLCPVAMCQGQRAVMKSHQVGVF
jgi:hypothetical protein